MNVEEFLQKLPAEFPYKNRSTVFPSATELFRILQKDVPARRTVENFYYLRGRVTSEPALWDNRFQNKYLYIIADTSRVDELSDHYLEPLRLQTHRNNSRSVLDYYADPVLRREMAVEHLKRYPSGSIKPEDLRETLYHLTYESKQFRPSWGRGIIAALYPTTPLRGSPDASGLRMLDMSAGWGDRLIIAMSMSNKIASYTGYDPNINLKEGHDRMIKDFGDPNRHQIIYEAFEKAEVLENTYDFLLSSPPFFDVEIYPGGDQSIVNYPTLDMWFAKFLFPSLDKAWKALKINGYLAIHLSDLYEYTSADGEKKVLKLVDPLNLYIEQYLPLSSWVGCLGLTSVDFVPPPKGTSSARNAKAWPVWIWQKVSSSSQVRRWKAEIPRSLTNFVSKETLLEKQIDDLVRQFTKNPSIIPAEIRDNFRLEDANLILDAEIGITNYLLACYSRNLPLVAYFRLLGNSLITSDNRGYGDRVYLSTVHK